MSNPSALTKIVETPLGVTLVGAGPLRSSALQRALALAPVPVAADGGADRLLAAGIAPQAVIGDLDSLSKSARATLPADTLYQIDEQETTDLDKCLCHVAAPLLLAAGFSDGRADHALAAFSSLVRHPWQRCILIGRDLCFLAPPVLELRLPTGTRFSLFPMGRVGGTSLGLRWPIDGLELSPEGRIGTSNQTVAPVVRLSVDAPRALVVLPARHLRAAAAALRAAPHGPYAPAPVRAR